MINSLEKDFLKLKNDKKSKLLAGFFKTGPGQYGYGDKFLGVMVPETRKIANKYRDISLADSEKLLCNQFHEIRLCALLILVNKFENSNEASRKEIFDFYLKNTKYINNWDLVDLTAHKIVGAYLLDKDRDILYKLAKSDNLWERRISIISTFAFIRKNDFKDSIRLAEIHLNDKHDLMHKAVGWVIREIGKKDKKFLIDFLDKYSKIMPRTMLRYSIEKLSEKERLFYLSK